MVSAYVTSDLDGLKDEQLAGHLSRVRDIFSKLTYKTNGVKTYYYRIDPSISETEKGFWYVNLDGDGFEEHEPTDITLYDTKDTSHLVWFTVPKATGASIWLPPYITDNLDVRVISYNVPVYWNDRFVGVIGIEIDYSTMAEQVDHISLYDNGYAFINDAESNLIYHPHIDVPSLAEPIKSPDGLPSDNLFFRYTFDGVEKQGVCLPLSNGMRLNVAVPVSEINALWQRWINQIFIIAIVLIVVAIFVTMRFSDRITKPLRKLTEVAEKKNDGDYDSRLDYGGNDEVGVLTNTFNRLTAHLKNYITDLNNLAYADALTSVHNIEDLVVLTRLDEMKESELTDVDLSAVVAESSEPFRSVAENDGKRFNVDIAPDIRIKGDKRGLQQIVSILLDNAVKYCDANGAITVKFESRARGKGAKIVISNTYVDGKDVDTSRFFERFYRQDESHNSEKSGFGIGLSMAKEITERMKGKLRVNYSGDTISFTVEV